MKLSIIIVSWNVRDKLKKNLKAIFESELDDEFEVFVVDNNSSDASTSMVREEFPVVKLIENKENLGFSRANNQAIKKAAGEYILLLNPDMLPEANTFKKILDWYKQNKDVSVAGCHLVDENSKTITNVRRFPSLSDQLAIVLKLPHFFPGILNKYLYKDFDYNVSVKVDSIRGGFFMINRNKFQGLPLLDERYFLWFEEVDFCRSLRERGEEVWYCAEAKCTDLVGQSFTQVKRLKTQRYFRDSMLKYFRKWHGFGAYAILYLAWIPVLLLAIIVDLLNIKGKAKT